MQPIARPSRISGANRPERQPIFVASAFVRGNRSKTASRSDTTITVDVTTALAANAVAIERPAIDHQREAAVAGRGLDAQRVVVRQQQVDGIPAEQPLAARHDRVEDRLRVRRPSC